MKSWKEYYVIKILPPPQIFQKAKKMSAHFSIATTGCHAKYNTNNNTKKDTNNTKKLKQHYSKRKKSNTWKN